MRRFTLIWDDETVEHLAGHGVSPEEAEEVCQARPHVLRTRRGRYLVLGQSGAGRYLTLVVAPGGQGSAKVVTGRAMTDTERRHYLRR